MLDFEFTQLAPTIDLLLSKGFQPPLYFTAHSTNGAVVYGRFFQVEGKEGLECDILISSPKSLFTAPINILFLDQTGETSQVVIGWPGTPEIVQNFDEQNMDI